MATSTTEVVVTNPFTHVVLCYLCQKTIKIMNLPDHYLLCYLAWCEEQGRQPYCTCQDCKGKRCHQNREGSAEIRAWDQEGESPRHQKKLKIEAKEEKEKEVKKSSEKDKSETMEASLALGLDNDRLFKG